MADLRRSVIGESANQRQRSFVGRREPSLQETHAVVATDLPEDPPGLLVWLPGWYTPRATAIGSTTKVSRSEPSTIPDGTFAFAWETKLFERIGSSGKSMIGSTPEWKRT